MTIKFLPDEVAIHYSELLQRTVKPLPDGAGLSFITKTIKGQKYWYLQNRVGNHRNQIYLGADSAELLKKIEQEKALWESTEDDLNVRKKLIAMLRAGGGSTLHRTEARVLQALERGGVFVAGGVLVGTLAFRSYSNSLGVVWTGNTQTQDIDMAATDSHSLALPDKELNIQQILEETQLGVFEVPALNPKQPSTKFSIGKKEYMVDVLTSDRGKPAKGPIYLNSFKTYAEPIRYLDYLLNNIEPAVMCYGAGILVNVPNPAFYAVHKCVISQRRTKAFKVKSQKDLKQATVLFEVLNEVRPGDIILALEAAGSMGDKFVKQLQQAIRQLPKKTQEIILEYS